MPTITRPDGATIYYEVHGDGYPLLLIAPGGISSQVEVWRNGPIDPMRDFASDFQVIAMDQRHAARSLAPAAAFDYDLCADDQAAVLDAIGARTAHVMGGCIGCAHIWRLIQRHGDRITAAIPQNPVGLDETNTPGTFYAMFSPTMRLARADGMKAVADSAVRNPMFMVNNEAGPFAPRIAADDEFRAKIESMPVESYVALIVRFRDGTWPTGTPFFTATREWMQQCRTPMLVLPGSDAFHPTSIAHLICELAPNARCLDVDCRTPERLAATIEKVRAFLKSHTPAA